MITRKKILILLLLVILTFGFYFFFFRRGLEKKNQSAPSPSIFPIPSPVYFDPTKHQALIYEDPQKNYSINEIQSNKSYQIVIIGSPFSTYRNEAENAFLSLLKISKDQACKMKVSVTTPYFANPDESGQTYPLSFCIQP